MLSSVFFLFFWYKLWGCGGVGVGKVTLVVIKTE